MKTIITILFLLVCLGCRTLDKKIVEMSSNAQLESTTLPRMVNVSWIRNCPTTGLYTNIDNTVDSYSDIYTVLLKSPNLVQWKIACVTNGTNFVEPMMPRMFYMDYNSNVVTTAISDFGTAMPIESQSDNLDLQPPLGGGERRLPWLANK